MFSLVIRYIKDLCPGINVAQGDAQLSSSKTSFPREDIIFTSCSSYQFGAHHQGRETKKDPPGFTCHTQNVVSKCCTVNMKVKTQHMRKCKGL